MDMVTRIRHLEDNQKTLTEAVAALVLRVRHLEQAKETREDWEREQLEREDT